MTSADKPRRPWPWPEENGKIEDAIEYTDETIAVFTVLRDWLHAMEAGTAEYRLPDPDYVRPNGKPPFTEAQLTDLVEVALDEYFEQTANANYALNTRGIWHDAGPEFRRLGAAQRLALAQELERVITTPPESPEPIP